MNFIIAGGGTGGHIYPALAIARGLKERFGAEVHYIGGSRGLEGGIVPREGLPFHSISLAGFKRSLSPSNLAVVWSAAMGVKRSSGLIRKIRPAAVIGTGGYVCGPVVLAAALSGVPTLIHEQNAFPGITNRMLSRFVSAVALTFGEARKHFPAGAALRVTGLPVRRELLDRDRDRARSELGVPPDRLLVLSFGGSQGAGSINKAMLTVLKRFAGDRMFFLHVTGTGNYDSFMKEVNKGINLSGGGNITITSYMHDMPGALAASDLAICRAGAATLAEIAAVGLPAILIPYPHAAENHQEHNARAMEGKGAAVVIRDRDLSGDLLVSELERLTERPETLKEMAGASKGLGRPRALDDILDCVADIMDNKRK